jgi:Predicted integral membrane protein (DUF2269)
MSLFELLLFLHILAAGVWLGSGVALSVITRRALAASPGTFGTLAAPAGWWGGRAHPGAGLVLLLTGPAMIAEADLSFGKTWIIIGLVGLVALFALGGGGVGRTSDELVKRVEADGGALTAESEPLAQRLLTLMLVETVLLALIIFDMVIKPGA